MTTKEVKARLKKAGKTWRSFRAWMSGQTVGGTPDDPDWYEDDVERFIRNKNVVD